MHRMKAIIKRSVTFLLALVISFISVVSFCDVPEAHATAVDLYSAEQVIATLMYSLGISADVLYNTGGALQPDTTSSLYQVLFIDYGGIQPSPDPDQEPEQQNYVIVPSKQDADTTLQLLLEADAARRPDIEAMVETAQKTGKIVIDEASGLWEYLKENIGKVVTSLKKPDSESADYYNMKSDSFTQSDLSNYILSTVSSQFLAQGVSWSPSSYSYWFEDSFPYSSKEIYIALFYNYCSNGFISTYDDNDIFTVYNEGVRVFVYTDYSKFLKLPTYVKSYYSDPDASSGYYADWDYLYNYISASPKCFKGSAPDYISGQASNLLLLTPSSFQLWQKNYTPNIGAKDNYDRAYDPTPGHTTDIITPSNQVEQKPDGSYDVTGDYVIDMTNPVTYPVDLTDGVTLDDKRTPVTELATVKDPITNPDPDPDTDTDPEPEPEPEPEPASWWERLFQWLSKIYNALIRLPQILTNNGLVFGNIVTVLNTISLAVHAIQTAAEGLLSGFDGLEIPDYADLIWELPARFADIIEFPEIDFPEFPEINIPEIPNYLDILKQMLEFLKNLLKLGNIETLLQSMFVFDTAAIALALDELLDVWNFDFLKDLRDKFGAFAFSDECLYPKIKIARPKIFAPYYKDQYIVLCDFADYKSQLSWCRNTIRMMIWIYFIYSIFRHFKVRLSLS